MTVNLSALAGAGQQFFDNNGNPLTGGKLWSYVAGTTTPQTTYTTALGNVAHTNPIILDSAGRISTGEIWLTAGLNYKFVLMTSANVMLATWDNITGINGTGIATNAVYVAYDPAGTGSVSTTVQAKLRQNVSVFDFMSSAQIADVQAGTLLVDVSAAIQAAIDANLNGNIIVFPSGKYLINTTLVKPASFKSPSFQGQGFQQTEFHYPNVGTEAVCLEIIGGSGAIISTCIDGIGFYGTLSSTGTGAILIDGQDGVLITRCLFGTGKYGILFYNRSSGAFTEYCIAEYCQFNSDCGVKIYYAKTVVGNNSFHGSGFRNCTMNTDTAVTNYPAVVVEDGCLVYNAPLSGQFWIAGTDNAVLIRNNNTGTLNCNWNGTITIESFGPVLILAETGLSTVRTFFVGSVVSINQYFGYGSLTVCHDFYSLTDGSTHVSKKPWSVTGTATTGTTSVDLALPPADSSIGRYNSFLLFVSVIGVNYDYSYLVSFVPGFSIGPSAYVSVLHNAQQFNSSGWGSVTFGVGGVLAAPTLTITNTNPAFNTTYTIGITQVGYGQTS